MSSTFFCCENTDVDLYAVSNGTFLAEPSNAENALIHRFS